MSLEISANLVVLEGTLWGGSVVFIVGELLTSA